jgi:hypothetical protein
LQNSPSENARVQGTEQVTALRPRLLRKNAVQRGIQHGMVLVPIALLALAQYLPGNVRIVVQFPDRLLRLAVAGAVLVVIDRFVVHGRIVRQNTDRLDGGDVAQVPVGPVVVDGAAVVLEQELVAERVEDCREHGDGVVEFGPAAVRAQDFGGVGELVAVQAAGEVLVRGAVDGFDGGAPGV